MTFFGAILAVFVGKKGEMKKKEWKPHWIGLMTAFAVITLYLLGAKMALGQTQPPSSVARTPDTNEVRIVGSDGSPVPFATVLNRKNGQAVSADVNGNVRLPLTGIQDTLVVKSLGYLDLLVPITSEVPNVLRMVTDPVALDEVEVVSESASFDQVTAMRSIQSLATKSVESVRRVEVPENAAELLWSTGSVLVQQSQQGGGSPIIRGFEANRILLVVDGVRLNNAIYRSGHLQNAITIDPNVLAQTEVVMGPNSVVYGSDALGGVIHYRTRDPRFNTHKWTSRASVAYRTPNRSTRLHADVEYGGNRWASLTSVSLSRFGDLRMGSRRPHGDENWGLDTLFVAQIQGVDTVMRNEEPTLQVGSGYDQLDLLQKWRFQSRIGTWGLNLQYSTSSQIPRYDVSSDFSGDELKWAEWSYGPQERLMAALNYGLYARHLGGIQFQAQTAFQKIGEERIQRRLGSEWRQISRETVLVWSGSVSASRNFPNQIHVALGLDFQLNDVESQAHETHLVTSEMMEVNTRYPSGGSSMNMFGTFLSARKMFSHRGVITAGVRYSNATLAARFLPQSTFELPFENIQSSKGAWTGGVSGQWNVSPSWRLNASASNGFRHPNIDDIGKVREKRGFVIVPNDSLRPEYLYSWEQGATWNLQGKGLLELGINGFVTFWKDAIVPVNAMLEGDTMMWIDGDSARVQTHVNASSAWVRGARLSLKAQLFPKVSMEGAVNWTFGQERETGSPLGHIPPTFGRLALDFEHKWMTWVLHAQFSGFKPIDQFGSGSTDNADLALPQGSPAWWTLNLESRMRFSQGFELRLGMRNILDMHYRVFASGISAAGRGVHASGHFMF